MGTTFLTVQRHLVVVRPQLLDARMTDVMRRAVMRRNAAGVIPYALATVGAAVTPYVTLAICALIAAYYVLPGTTDLDLRTDS